MKIHYMEQRSHEWREMRKGKMTASAASKLITATGRASTQYKGEIGRIIAEGMDLQNPEFIKPTYWMEQGVELEPQARTWFEVETGLEVTECGFIESDDSLFGVSPDGFIDTTDGVIPIELKCPKPSTHIKWMMDGGMPAEHQAQVHLAMIITEAPYAWFMSYNPNLAPIILKIERSEFTEMLEKQMNVYSGEYLAALKIVKGEDLEEST